MNELMSMSIGTGGPWGKHGRPQEFLQEGAKYIAPPFPLHPFPCLHSSPPLPIPSLLYSVHRAISFLL